MKLPATPQPLTPQYAEHLAKRWKWTGCALGICTLALMSFGFSLIATASALLTLVVLLEARSLQGWAGGYRACHRSHCKVPDDDGESP